MKSKLTLSLLLFATFAGFLRADQAIKNLTLTGTTTDSSTFNISGAHTFLSGASATFASGSTLTLNGTLGGSGTFNFGSGTVTLPATVTGGTTSFQPRDSDLDAIAALSTTGILVRTGSGTATTRTITGNNTGANITVTSGDGVAGNPTLELANTTVTAGTFGSATAVGTVTVDAKGRITSASNTTISSTTIAGTAVAPGGSISQDTITGLASTGLVKRTGANTLAIATSGTDYLPGWSGLTTNGLLQATGATTVASTLTPSGLTSLGVNSLTSASGQNLTLGTGTFGTALTFTSATGAATFAASASSPIYSTTSHTTTAGGYVIGTDWQLYRTAAGGVTLGSLATGNGTYVIKLASASTSTPTMGLVLDTSAAGNASLRNWGFYTNNTSLGDLQLLQSTSVSAAPSAVIATFTSGGVTIPGSILGSGGSAPTSTTSGSNIFTAGIATSGPAYLASLNVIGSTAFSDTWTLTRAQGYATIVSSTGTNPAYLNFNNTGGNNYYIGIDSSAGSTLITSGGAAYALALASDTGRSVILAPGRTAQVTATSTGTTIAGNLTVSGTGTSSFAGAVQLNTASGTETTLTLNQSGVASWAFRNIATTAEFRLATGGNDWFKVAQSTGNTSFTSATSGTSTTAAAILGKSMGLTENLWVGGTGNFAGDVTVSAGNLWVQNNGTVGSQASGSSSIAFGGSSMFFKSGSTNVASIQSATTFSVLSTTEATTGGAGSLTTAGGIYAAKQIIGATGILSFSPTAGIGYATGAGGAVTQITSRTTGVTLNKVSGAITLVSAAGTASWQTFTVTDSAVAATDTISINQKSGTDKYMIHVTAVAAGSFNVTFATTGGTTTEQPVFQFNVIKGSNS